MEATVIMDPHTETPAAAPQAWTGAIRAADVDSGVSQPCLSNLVVYTEDPSEEAAITETITQYILKHPCRAIVILAQPRGTPPRLEAKFSSHTFGDGTGKSVACEQITLNAIGAAVKELASAIQPLLVADLPIYIWWRGVFLNQRMLVEQMLTYADRFIYDGVTWTSIHYTVQQVADFLGRYDEKVGFTNFNWARLRPWRESAADFFDAGMFENEIWELNHLRVEYMSLPGFEEGYQFRSLLLVAWLAVQLEWEPLQSTPGIDEVRLEFKDKKGNSVLAEMIQLPQSTQTSQGVQKVILSVQNPARFHAFTIERDYKERLMILRHEDKEGATVLRTVPHADSTTADLLYRELGRRVRNRVFEKSFKMASALLQMI